MTIREKLKVHREIEQKNRQNLIEWRKSLTTNLTTKRRTKTARNATKCAG